MTLDDTHDPQRRSWVASAVGHRDFPIQNLPFGVFAPPGEPPRGGVAIGDQILDLSAVARSGLLSGEALDGARAASGGALNAFLALGSPVRRALRAALSDLLRAGAPQADRVAPLLYEAADCTLLVPAEIGDYTDFYAGINHARNVGRLFRPDNPLLPNYKWVPIGYHGRASSIRPSGTPIRRPSGQSMAPGGEAPTFGLSRRLDIELEVGIWVGPGNDLGETVPIAEAGEHIAGFCLLNDWSARDIQPWEYQPLGPFLAKSFQSSISPWIITPEALAPFRIAQPPRPQGDPAPLPYLFDPADQSGGALDVQLEVWLSSVAMREQGLGPMHLSLSNMSHLYWTPAQLLAHHTSNGCNLRPGDLLGTGTISGPAPDSLGSLLEMSQGGKTPLTLPTGETRAFLADGDEVIIRGRAEREGLVSIGLGEVRGMITP